MDLTILDVWWPLFFFWWVIFSTNFYVLWKNEKYISSTCRGLNILQNAPLNSIHLTSSFSCAAVSNASLRVKVCDNDAIFEIINATDSLVQNVIWIVCLCWLIYFNLKTLETMLNYMHQFIKITLSSFAHALPLKRSLWPPIFISFLKQVNDYLSAVEVYFHANVLKTYLGCCGCDVLSALCTAGLCAPLGWSGLPNRKAFRKLISENRGERIHKNSSENDRFPDSEMALLLFWKIKIWTLVIWQEIPELIRFWQL